MWVALARRPRLAGAGGVWGLVYLRATPAISAAPRLAPNQVSAWNIDAVDRQNTFSIFNLTYNGIKEDAEEALVNKPWAEWRWRIVTCCGGNLWSCYWGENQERLDLEAEKWTGTTKNKLRNVCLHKHQCLNNSSPILFSRYYVSTFSPVQLDNTQTVCTLMTIWGFFCVRRFLKTILWV